ncbi:hypothetical protein MACJ_003734 [Theileria orientalis]|uniref:Uncharacterized protein n=1 Tax=Theileria orientalis TaxID=68886 RepID=A0A976XJT6_THEOR|nr:hypothetical protein MACJ_003734 [Theileria orientalis]
MKACGVVAISAVVLIILGISLYFGLRKVGKVNVTYVPFSSKFSKFDIPISKDRSVLVIDLDNGSFLDNDKLSSTSSDVPGLDGYKKILFSSPQRKHIDEAMVRYDKLEIVPGIFSRATIYTWFGDPMLLIINTIQVVDDKEVNRFHYFTHSDGSFGSYSAYQIDTDIQDNLVEIQKLLKKINKDRKHLFTLDLDNDLGDPTIEYPSLEPDGFNVTKYLDRYKPFIDVKLKSPLRINGSKFQIDKLIHNGKDIKINLPNYQFYFIFIYYWNMNPVLIDFESKTKHNYFVSRSADEWIPLTNCSGHIINGQLSDQELRKRLKYIIMKTFNAYFLDIDNTDSYDFSGEEVSVITERPTSDDVGTSIKYKHFLPKGVFKLGACSQNGVLIDVVPIGLDLEYMTVHYSNSISIMIRLAVVENGMQFYVGESVKNQLRLENITNHKITNHKITNHKITNHEITNHEITNHKITNHEITNHKITNHKITNHKITNHKITNHKITNHEITNHKITNHKITNHEITNHKITNHKITNHEITNHEITNHKITNHKITNHKITNHEITNHKITNHKITNHKITNHKITNHKITNHKITNHKITNHKITNHKITNHKIILRKIPKIQLLYLMNLKMI